MVIPLLARRVRSPEFWEERFRRSLDNPPEGSDSFPAYWRGCHREFRESLALMDPGHYAG